MTAADARRHLDRLLAERHLALATGSTTVSLKDLDADLESSRDAYVGLAVTEIATLRAALDGPLLG